MNMSSLSMQVKEHVQWSLLEKLELLPGRSTIAVVMPSGAEPTEAMSFERVEIPFKCTAEEQARGAADPNMALDVVTQLVWQDTLSGEYRVLISNRSGLFCRLSADTTIMRSDPVA